MFPGGKRQGYLEGALSIGRDVGFMRLTLTGEDAAWSVCIEVGMLGSVQN